MLRKQIGDYEALINAQQDVVELIKSGDLNGCYINGKKILSKEEKQAIVQEKLIEYETYKQGVFDSISTAIEEQKNEMKR